MDTEIDRAWLRLIRYLALRDHSARELETKLARHHPPAVIKSALARALDEGLLASDAKIAARYREGFERKGKSRRYIEAQLRARGLPVPDRTEDDDRDEVRKARELVAAKFGDPLELAFEERGRAFRFLKYRGFEDRHIRRVFEHEE